MSICLTLTRISSHACTLSRAHRNTHTLHKLLRSGLTRQLSSSPISLVSTVTAGRAEEFCDARLQSCRRMNGLSVLSAVSPRPKCLSWTRNDEGMWWHNSDSGGRLVSWSQLSQNYVFWVHREQVWVFLPEVWCCVLRGTACWGLEQCSPITSNNKKPFPATCQSSSLTSSSYFLDPYCYILPQTPKFLYPTTDTGRLESGLHSFTKGWVLWWSVK